jgi:hypothetical protein
MGPRALPPGCTRGHKRDGATGESGPPERGRAKSADTGPKSSGPRSEETEGRC